MDALLSHYTDEAGLLGIARTKSLWARNFLHLNDTSEYFYGWAAIQRHALKSVQDAMPADKIHASFDIEAYIKHVNEKFKAEVAGMDGYGALYVVSFARAQTPDQEARGILTLWDRYTRYKGFCLQFRRSDIQRWVDAEQMWNSYGILQVVDVKYGIDETAHDFLDLSWQLAIRMRKEIARYLGDWSLGPKDEELTRMWAESYLHRKTMHYCGHHKDPCFEDEREVRIFAYPAAQSDVRVFTGIASKKKIHMAGGKKHLVICEHIKPGVIPCRVIVGPHATFPKDDFEKCYDPMTMPEIAVSNLPVAAP